MTASIVTLQSIIDQLAILTNVVLSNKQTLNLKEAAAFTGLAESYLYKLTSNQEIPHYKPRGKILYFDRSELETWLRRGKINSQAEIEQQAAIHIAASRGV